MKRVSRQAAVTEVRASILALTSAAVAEGSMVRAFWPRKDRAKLPVTGSDVYSMTTVFTSAWPLTHAPTSAASYVLEQPTVASISYTP